VNSISEENRERVIGVIEVGDLGGDDPWFVLESADGEATEAGEELRLMAAALADEEDTDEEDTDEEDTPESVESIEPIEPDEDGDVLRAEMMAELAGGYLTERQSTAAFNEPDEEIEWEDAEDFGFDEPNEEIEWEDTGDFDFDESDEDFAWDEADDFGFEDADADFEWDESDEERPEEWSYIEETGDSLATFSDLGMQAVKLTQYHSEEAEEDTDSADDGGSLNRAARVLTACVARIMSSATGSYLYE